ncbi:MAG: HRDC domain-containing protein [Planctomycetaceae bacterium]|nr:HRDC domain-containing protein [Planctomycetaceae bacterium]
MSHRIVATQSGLRELCQQLADAPQICFDTEFVSEHTYRPELCLVQVAWGKDLAAIDPFGCDDVTPFWETIVRPGHETVVHAGRQELLFCLDAVGQPPAQLFDVQVAAGMVGFEYPAGYGTLVNKLLGLKASKGETRTDWRQRPLSHAQIEYALEDVRHLARFRELLGERLTRLNRQAWFETEMTAWQTDIDQSRTSDRWRRVAGSSGLGGRGLAIVRAVWHWREEEAFRRNRPVKQILRDDLIVEIAKRKSADPRHIGAIRGMERGDLKRAIPEMADAVKTALDLADHELPPTVRLESNSHLTMLGQFLSSALGSICQQAEVATSLVGTPSDVRDLIAWRLNGATESEKELPTLATGWRAEVVGHLLEDLLAGKVAVRIKDPSSEQPLAFERMPISKNLQ